LRLSEPANFAGEPHLFRLNCRRDNEIAILIPEVLLTPPRKTGFERKSLLDRSLFLQGNGVNTVGLSSLNRPYAELAGTL
jgi:hypothetical protein